MPVLPNFFIVGAPKSGTTALYEYLKKHPKVFMPDYKEPHFYAPDLESTRYVVDRERYEGLFSGGVGAKRVGESSVYYLLSKEAASRISEDHPEANIIIMLRNPTDMIYSLHSQRLYSGHEDIESFEEAIEAEGARRNGERIPTNADPIKCLFYTQVGSYSAQVERFLGQFQRSKIMIVLFDDFSSDTPGVYKQVCRFLDVEEVEIDGKRHNPNKQVRSAALRDALKFSPGVKKAVRSVLPRSVRQRVAKRVVAMNTHYVQRERLDPTLRRRLDEQFRPDVERLEKIIGRDLSQWANSHIEFAKL